MNDRFKFRYVYEDKVYDVVSIEFDHEIVFIEDGFFKMIRYDNLLQCTGLKDRNGILIYEGDIVEVIPEEDEDDNGVIEWNNDTARFDIHLITQKVCADFDNYYSYELEVMGNIYENPELLKGENNERQI